MQLPTPKTPASRCIALGLYSQAMFAKFADNPVLVGLSAAVTSATTGLTSAQSAYAQAVVAIITPRVAVKYADFTSDRAVRAAQRAAETADGEKFGKVATAVFPDGVTPIVRPVGQTQCDLMRALEGRLEAAASIWPGAMAEKAKITAERTTYEASLAARRTAMEVASDLRAKRDAAKEDFLDVMAAAAGRVKEQFPRNRAMQDLFFDRVTDAAAIDDDAEDDETAPAATPALPPPAPPG